MVLAEWHAHRLAQLAQEDGDVRTITSYVYVTAPYPTTTSSTSSTPTTVFTTKSVYNAPSRQARPTPSTSMGSSIILPSGLLSSSVASSLIVPSTTSAPAAPLVTSPLQIASVSHPNGMSGGAKAGLAIGILIIIGLLAALGFFLYRRKQKADNENHQRIEDEKSEMAARSQSNPFSNPSSSNANESRIVAPRLSLRPLTQMFMPSAEKQDEKSATLPTVSPRSITPEPVSPESKNPFGDHAEEKAAAIAAPAAAAVASSPASETSDRPVSALSERSNGSSASNGQAFPTVVAGSRRNSPPGPGPNNVHRVQLDFKPSMEDELELRAGSLVRMLHEYDDGWALCIRLDRSQQGVVPRTCISKLPVKPRASPSPQSMRGPAPQAPGARPYGPPHAGPGPRPGPQNGPGPRAYPPAGRMRSQSNSPRQHQGPNGPAFSSQGARPMRPRSNSDAMAAGRQSPAPSNSSATSSNSNGAQAALPARKPVPGQAM